MRVIVKKMKWSLAYKWRLERLRVEKRMWDEGSAASR